MARRQGGRWLKRQIPVRNSSDINPCVGGFVRWLTLKRPSRSLRKYSDCMYRMILCTLKRLPPQVSVKSEKTPEDMRLFLRSDLVYASGKQGELNLLFYFGDQFAARIGLCHLEFLLSSRIGEWVGLGASLVVGVKECCQLHRLAEVHGVMERM